MTSEKAKRIPVVWIVAAVVLLGLGVFVIAMIFAKQSTNAVNNFQTCKDADGIILETYPEQCIIGGQSFINEAQSANNDSQQYIGLAEEFALNKAAEAGKAARVVQRDNEDLPVTMDFSPGRLNFYVADGSVYMVQVEGE